MYLECKVREDSYGYLHFQFKMPENGRKNIFTDK